nr:hypothetical protein [Kofleriaceae bacterium]
MTRWTSIAATAGCLVGGARAARAQLPPDVGPPQDPPPVTATPPPPPTQPAPATQPPQDPYAPAADQPAARPAKPRPPDPPIAMPELLRSPTAWLLPAAVMYWKTSVDTGGGVTTNGRVGLGDVAEFGVSTIDSVRAKLDDTRTEDVIQPYVTATFRMGLGEGRLFDDQPALALGFEKSFQRNHDGFATRTAELTLVASKHFGKHAALHVGGSFWDASLRGDGEGDQTISGFDNVTLHDSNDLGNQIRPFGGVQLEPIANSEILVDLSWAPVFCYSPAKGACADGQITLQPELSWGVRYRVADWVNLESGVRLPNIGKADLLDAQIFGTVTFTSWGLRHAVDGLK